MLGINVADAVAIVGVAIALLAAFNGMKAGDAAKKSNPPDPPMAILSTTLVETAVMRDLVDILADINETMRLGISVQQDRANHRFEELLEEISEKLDGKPSKPTRGRA